MAFCALSDTFLSGGLPFRWPPAGVLQPGFGGERVAGQSTRLQHGSPTRAGTERDHERKVRRTLGPKEDAVVSGRAHDAQSAACGGQSVA